MYVLKFWLLQPFFLNRGSFLICSFLNRDIPVLSFSFILIYTIDTFKILTGFFSQNFIKILLNMLFYYRLSKENGKPFTLHQKVTEKSLPDQKIKWSWIGSMVAEGVMSIKTYGFWNLVNWFILYLPQW